MKILFVYRHCSHGGVETTIFNRVKGLRCLGVDAQILFLYDSGAYPSFGAFPFVHFSDKEEEITSFITREGFDVLTVIDSPYFYPVLPRATFSGLLITETHVTENPALDYLLDITATGTVAVIVPSLYNRQIAGRRVGNQCPIYVLHNNVDLEAFHFIDSRDNWQGPRPHISPGHKLICWIGRLEPLKRPLEFVHIAYRVSQLAPEIDFCLVGGEVFSPQRDQVLEEIQKLGLQERFQWLPAVLYQDMTRLYSLAAKSGGCVISTSAESFSMVMLEAMACQCPVIGTHGGGNDEIITDGINGRLFSSGDIEGAVRLVLEVCRPGANRDRLIENAWILIEENYSNRKIAASYLEIIKEIADTL